jgi:hypothetical protein
MPLFMDRYDVPAVMNVVGRVRTWIPLGLLVISACGGQDGAATETRSTSVTTSTTSVRGTIVTTQPTTTTHADPGTEDQSPCELTDREAVAEFFGGTVAEGNEGFATNCSYFIDGGDGGTQKVDVFDLGPASAWEDIRTQYEESRMGIIEVEGIGDGAFHPVDHGVRDLVFRTSGQVYSIVAFGGATPEQLSKVETAVLSLASWIVDHQN